MDITDDIEEQIQWISGEGSNSTIVLSSRVRLARNLAGFPFPTRAPETTRQDVLNRIKEAVKDLEERYDLGFVSLSDLSPLTVGRLVETHLISPYHAQPGPARGLVLRRNGTLSIMVNEEDHLRIQGFLAGLQLPEAWNLLNAMDDELEARLDFAFSEQWGYLTACPTNVGTAMRCSTMLHLPALAMTNMLQNVAHSIQQLGMVFRGLFGEGTEGRGSFFQLSNQITLGQTEEDLVGKISGVTLQLVEQEISAREKLLQDFPMQLEDRLWRAHAILREARIITGYEALELLSLVRMGTSLGVLPELPLPLQNRLLLWTRPAILQHRYGEEPDPHRRDALRAKFIRETLANAA